MYLPTVPQPSFHRPQFPPEASGSVKKLHFPSNLWFLFVKPCGAAQVTDFWVRSLAYWPE